MARLFGYVGNRSDVGSRVLELAREPLKVSSKGNTVGWGFGFYQSGEVLLRRRPIDERPEIDTATLAQDLRADLLIGHVRNATVGNIRTENTHPFRYRQWLFAHTGTLVGFSEWRGALAALVPEFLIRNVRGDTDSELMFHLFLADLHTAGNLVDGAVGAAATRAAVRSMLKTVDRICQEGGVPAAPLNLLVSDGEHMVAAHRNATMAYRVVRGRELERPSDDSVRQGRAPDMATTRFSIIASDFDVEPLVPWVDVPTQSLVTLTRTDDPTVEPL